MTKCEHLARGRGGWGAGEEGKKKSRNEHEYVRVRMGVKIPGYVREAERVARVRRKCVRECADWLTYAGASLALIVFRISISSSISLFECAPGSACIASFIARTLLPCFSTS